MIRQGSAQNSPSPRKLGCVACDQYAAYRLGAIGWPEPDSRIGFVRADDWNWPVAKHPPTVRRLSGIRDAEGNDLGVIEEEVPNPEAGKPLTFEWAVPPAQTDHQGRRVLRPQRHRPEGWPPGYQLAGVEGQILAWLDHLKTAVGGSCGASETPLAHLQRVGGYGPEFTWLRRQVKLVERYFRDPRPWQVVRGAAARRLLAALTGLPETTIRRRLQNHRVRLAQG